jgi:hypothetical protein
MDDRTLSYGESVTGALLGVDALYRRESGDAEGLVVLNMDTDGRYPPETFEEYRDADRRFAALHRESRSLPDADRRVYYDQVCRSTRAFIAWRDGGLPFEAQLGCFLHVLPEAASKGALDALRGEMRSTLNELGHTGDLAAQCADWQERHRVPPDEAAEAAQDLLDEAWVRTEERLLEIPAPQSDGMVVVAVTGAPFNARCDYLARRIELNIDPVLTRPSLKHLAVHEGCPGHYVQFKLRETMAREGAATADVLLSVVNTASSSVFEGIADMGLEMLEWVDSADDRLQALMNRYRAGIATAAAWRLHAEGLPERSVADWLHEHALVGGEGWVENRMKFIAAPSRAVLIWSYWWGERSVAPAWRKVSPGRRSDFLRFLYGRMHSVDSVRMFEAEA